MQMILQKMSKHLQLHKMLVENREKLLALYSPGTASQGNPHDEECTKLHSQGNPHDEVRLLSLSSLSLRLMLLCSLSLGLRLTRARSLSRQPAAPGLVLFLLNLSPCPFLPL
jgi:hypothetical protein